MGKIFSNFQVEVNGSTMVVKKAHLSSTLQTECHLMKQEMFVLHAYAW